MCLLAYFSLPVFIVIACQSDSFSVVEKPWLWIAELNAILATFEISAHLMHFLEVKVGCEGVGAVCHGEVALL